MGMLEAERIGEVLWITGNVMPSEEKALQQAVQEFVSQVKTPGRTLDMSGVRYISSSAAKALLTLAQEAKEGGGGGKLKVRSSIPVVRTLSLLGAETYLEIEPCQKPNPKPTLGQQTGSSDSVGKLLPVAPRPAGTRDSNTRLQAINPPRAEGSEPAPAPGTVIRPGTRESHTQLPVATSPTETVMERRSSVGLNAPGTSAVRAPSAASATEQNALANAQARAGLPLATDDAELREDLALLKSLIVMRTYTFQIPATKNDITGKVLARAGGPWIIVDSHGARKFINIRHVAVVDLLA